MTTLGLSVAVEPPDLVNMRAAMGQFATGVTVITSITEDGQPAGCTISAFCSLSLEPPLVLVCIDVRRLMRDTLRNAHGYVVNILRDDQAHIALTFAGRTPNRFSGLATQPGRHGIPVIEGAIAHIECDREEVYAGGDHDIVVGRVTGLATGPGEPLLYSRGRFIDGAPSTATPAIADGAQEWLMSAPW